MIDRYSNPEIAHIWSLENKFALWLQVEIAVCEAWHRRGQIPTEDLQNIKTKAKFSVDRINEIESEVQHDVIAFLTNLKENIGPSGRFVHFGMTSSDVGDTALCMQLRQSTDILLRRIDTLLETTKKQAIRYKDQVMVGRTHGIHAEPITLGLKFAHFYAEMKRNRDRLASARETIAVGKLSGAVGTFSNIEPDLEEEVLSALELAPEPVATQVICRDRHAMYASVLGVIAGSLDTMAQEVRLLQKSEAREVEEPFAKGQKGSSAMPHKRNPVICERICGLARVIQANVQTAYRNMALWHERDISHSSAERVILPDSIIALDYILGKMNQVLEGLHVYPDSMERVLGHTRGLIFSQRLMLALVGKGLEREAAYAAVQKASMDVWANAGTSLRAEITKNGDVTKLLGEKELDEIFSVEYFLRNIPALYMRLGLM